MQTNKEVRITLRADEGKMITDGTYVFNMVEVLSEEEAARYYEISKEEAEAKEAERLAKKESEE
jgi:hypothetical protein